MSFATDLLDGFPLLNKRTEETLKLAGEMGKFFNSVASCRKDYQKSLRSLVGSGQKKLLEEKELDGSVKEAFAAFLHSLEDTVAGEATLTQQIADLGAEFLRFKKENEARRKKLQSDCDALMKEYNAQLETCKKARNTYQGLARDAEKQQQALARSNNDSTVKNAKLAQMHQKTVQAADKARAAEADYREVVRATNEKQSTVYTRDMPAVLMEFQAFEEARIRFMQDAFRKYAAGAATQPAVFEGAAAKVAAGADAIDVAADIAAYVRAHATHKTCPPAVEVEIYAGFDDSAGALGGPGSTGSSSSSSSNLLGGGAGAGGGAGGAGGAGGSCSDGNTWGLGPADAHLSPSQKASKLEGQIGKLEALVRGDEQQAAALERMSVAYAKDPVGKKKADAELAEFQRKIADDKATLERLRADLAALGGGGDAAAAGADNAAEDAAGGADAGADAGGGDGERGEPVKVRGLYDYTATCDTELTFHEGDIFYVTDRDESGWWYATIDDKQGFVPANYVEIVQ